jgi:hypothetical protein
MVVAPHNFKAPWPSVRRQVVKDPEFLQRTATPDETVGDKACPQDMPPWTTCTYRHKVIDQSPWAPAGCKDCAFFQTVDLNEKVFTGYHAIEHPHAHTCIRVPTEFC